MGVGVQQNLEGHQLATLALQEEWGGDLGPGGQMRPSGHLWTSAPQVASLPGPTLRPFPQELRLHGDNASCWPGWYMERHVPGTQPSYEYQRLAHYSKWGNFNLPSPSCLPSYLRPVQGTALPIIFLLCSLSVVKLSREEDEDMTKLDWWVQAVTLVLASLLGSFAFHLPSPNGHQPPLWTKLRATSVSPTTFFTAPPPFTIGPWPQEGNV
ncbi:Hypothetical predicted protein [Podarcis lilfordi]|uniref:Uncharacterized protein n=1 Tax=Podarcis lilfordi TaxID=74358 RepID=A0AA35LLW5_9SAUR|nr:Hypothetical predicted protein [Podarcis lilfordi]